MNGLERWLDMNAVELIGYLGTAFTIATYAMKTMVPLRIAGVLSSVAFISYGLFTHSYPVVATEVILLPLNGLRLYEMLQLTRNVQAATTGNQSMDWLKPYTHRLAVKAGDVLFRKGVEADRMFFAISGRYRLVETGVEVAGGQVLGEFGLISSGNRRTQTLECVEGGEMLTITYAETRELYFQNPKFGFYFLELVGRRLLENVALAEERTAAALERAERAEALLGASSGQRAATSAS